MKFRHKFPTLPLPSPAARWFSAYQSHCYPRLRPEIVPIAPVVPATESWSSNTQPNMLLPPLVVVVVVVNSPGCGRGCECECGRWWVVS